MLLKSYKGFLRAAGLPSPGQSTFGGIWEKLKPKGLLQPDLNDDGGLETTGGAECLPSTVVVHTKYSNIIDLGCAIVNRLAGFLALLVEENPKDVNLHEMSHHGLMR